MCTKLDVLRFELNAWQSQSIWNIFVNKTTRAGLEIFVSPKV